MNEEIWKPVVGYEGIYAVSSHGQIKRIKAGQGSHLKVLAPSNINGYRKVQLSRNDIKQQILVHRLVAEAFLPNPDGLKTVNHKNGVKDDNNLENLEWASSKENSRHARRTGLMKSKISPEDAIEIRRLYATGKYTQQQLGDMHGITQRYVSLILQGKVFGWAGSEHQEKNVNPAYTDLDGEIWKPCISFPKYEVSNLGRVRRVESGNTGTIVGRIINPRYTSNGSATLELRIDTNKKKFTFVAPLIAEAFLPAEPNSKIGYKDKQPGNTAADNLFWK